MFIDYLPVYTTDKIDVISYIHGLPQWLVLDYILNPNNVNKGRDSSVCLDSYCFWSQVASRKRNRPTVINILDLESLWEAWSHRSRDFVLMIFGDNLKRYWSFYFILCLSCTLSHEEKDEGHFSVSLVGINNSWTNFLFGGGQHEDEVLEDRGRLFGIFVTL